MTFTLAVPFDDIARVRLAIGDVDAAAVMLSDELIQGMIDEAGGWQKAALMALRLLIAQLAMPDYTADWLKVENSKAREGFERLLAMRESEYGGVGVNVVLPEREDK
jgi:hypothetical protein